MTAVTVALTAALCWTLLRNDLVRLGADPGTRRSQVIPLTAAQVVLGTAVALLLLPRLWGLLT